MNAKDVLEELDAIARRHDVYEYGLPTHSDESCMEMLAVVEKFLAEEQNKWKALLWHASCHKAGTVGQCCALNLCDCGYSKHMD